ncbi:hypothetical protein P691DRAFT_767853 [Macrolepiota fuliginosa MF-IS2]|uniref:Uncharacterized protein n=1 Tax=Macrolepiota fuliginosa MF-IS2 TaxID=1400762 RepID=A0A9P5WWN9_9AGAR|nr:hypothetical protein P691DRAFT_767853 [Macrolepiota fuliginosa MF-IS2]
MQVEVEVLDVVDVVQPRREAEARPSQPKKNLREKLQYKMGGRRRCQNCLKKGFKCTEHEKASINSCQECYKKKVACALAVVDVEEVAKEPEEKCPVEECLEVWRTEKKCPELQYLLRTKHVLNHIWGNTGKDVTDAEVVMVAALQGLVPICGPASHKHVSIITNMLHTPVEAVSKLQYIHGVTMEQVSLAQYTSCHPGMLPVCKEDIVVGLDVTDIGMEESLEMALVGELGMEAMEAMEVDVEEGNEEEEEGSRQAETMEVVLEEKEEGEGEEEEEGEVVEELEEVEEESDREAEKETEEIEESEEEEELVEELAEESTEEKYSAASVLLVD